MPVDECHCPFVFQELPHLYSQLVLQYLTLDRDITVDSAVRLVMQVAQDDPVGLGQLVSDVLFLLLQAGDLPVTPFHLLFNRHSLLVVHRILLRELAVLPRRDLTELVVHPLFEVPLVLFLLREVLNAELLSLVDEGAAVVLLQDSLLAHLVQLGLVHQTVLDLFVLELLDLALELAE